MGQVIGAILAESPEIAKKAVELVSVQYEDLPTLFTIEDAISANRCVEVLQSIGGAMLSKKERETLMSQSDSASFRLPYSLKRLDKPKLRSGKGTYNIGCLCTRRWVDGLNMQR